MSSGSMEDIDPRQEVGVDRPQEEPEVKIVSMGLRSESGYENESLLEAYAMSPSVNILLHDANIRRCR